MFDFARRENVGFCRLLSENVSQPPERLGSLAAMPNPTAPPPAPLPVADTGGKGAVKAVGPAPAGDLEAVRRRLRRLLPSLRQEYPIKSLGVFGSFARGEQAATSDLDILFAIELLCSGHPLSLAAFSRTA